MASTSPLDPSFLLPELWDVVFDMISPRDLISLGQVSGTRRFSAIQPRSHVSIRHVNIFVDSSTAEMFGIALLEESRLTEGGLVSRMTSISTISNDGCSGPIDGMTLSRLTGEG